MDRIDEVAYRANVTELWETRNGVLIPIVMGLTERVELTWRKLHIATLIPAPGLSDDVRRHWASEHNVGLRKVL